ncbi:MAG: FliH/SctL family protein [Pseudomonadota bacterium]
MEQTNSASTRPLTTIVRRPHIIRAAEYLAMLNAQQASKALREEQDDIIAAAQLHAETLRQAATAAGNAAGRNAYASQLASLALEHNRCWQKIESSIGVTVLSCVRRLLGEMGTNDALLTRVRAILQQLRPKQVITLRVSAAALPELRAALEQLEREFGAIDAFQIALDPHLSDSDCVIETLHGVVDARLESQLAAIRVGVEQALAADINDAAAIPA